MVTAAILLVCQRGRLGVQGVDVGEREGVLYGSASEIDLSEFGAVSVLVDRGFVGEIRAAGFVLRGRLRY